MEKINIEKWRRELRELQSILIEWWGGVGYLEKANLNAQNEDVKDYNSSITLAKYTMRPNIEMLLKRGQQMGVDIESISTIVVDSEA